MRVLRAESDHAADIVAGQAANVHPAELVRPAGQIDEAEQGRGQRGLARSAGADHRHPLSGPEVEIHAVHGGRPIRLVAWPTRPRAAQPDRPCRTVGERGGDCRLRHRHRHRGVQHAEYPLAAAADPSQRRQCCRKQLHGLERRKRHEDDHGQHDPL